MNTRTIIENLLQHAVAYARLGIEGTDADEDIRLARFYLASIDALSPFDQMVREYRHWCADQKLPDMSAEELRAELCADYPEVNADQVAWLDDYIERWDAMEENDPEYLTEPVDGNRWNSLLDPRRHA